MKYRRLTKEEFEELHEEFILFLSSNTITGDDWKKIVAEDIASAEELMDMFSDIAFEKVLSQSHYLERINPLEHMGVWFGENQAEMILLRSLIGVEIPKETTIEELKEAISLGQFELVKGTKLYSDLREREMFQLMQQNAVISDGKLFEQLKSLLS